MTLNNKLTNHLLCVLCYFFNQEFEIEKGRYNKTPCEEILCKNCGVIEDEAHFILKCKVNQNLRESLFNNIELDNDFFLKLF